MSDSRHTPSRKKAPFIGLHPERNDVGFMDPVGADHDALGVALNKALYNYMHGIGLDADVREWFAGRSVPKTRVARHFIARALG